MVCLTITQCYGQKYSKMLRMSCYRNYFSRFFYKKYVLKVKVLLVQSDFNKFEGH